MKKFLLYSWMFLAIAACKKKAEEPNPANTIIDPETGQKLKIGNIKLEFEHVVGNAAFQTNTNFLNSSGETFQVSTLRYYISNVKLKKPDGSFTVIPKTYHLVSAVRNNANLNASPIITIPNVPEGNYSGVSFLIGVDSVQTESGAQTGDLSPDLGMLWVWEGYSPLEFMGKSAASKSSDKSFSYQIFGYKEPHNASQTISCDFGTSLLMAKQNATPIVHFKVDILEFFQTPKTISIANLNSTVTKANSTNKMLSENYKDMFRFEHIHN